MVTVSNVVGLDGATYSARAFLRAWSVCSAFSVMTSGLASTQTPMALCKSPGRDPVMTLSPSHFSGSGSLSRAGAEGSEVRQAGTENGDGPWDPI